MRTIAKAISAGVTALLGSLAVALEDNGLTGQEITIAISAGVAAFGATYFVSNGVSSVRGPRGGIGV